MSSFTKKLVWPALGLLLVGALVAQARGMSIMGHGTRTPDASTAESTNQREPLHIRGEGRVATYPGAQVTLGSELSARLLKLDAQEGRAVKKGDVLAELDTSELRPQLARRKRACASCKPTCSSCRPTSVAHRR